MTDGGCVCWRASVLEDEPLSAVALPPPAASPCTHAVHQAEEDVALEKSFFVHPFQLRPMTPILLLCVPLPSPALHDGLQHQHC
jgi:hypothetical protein